MCHTLIMHIFTVQVAPLFHSEFLAVGGVPQLVSFISDPRAPSDHLESALRLLLRLVTHVPPMADELCNALLLPALLPVIQSTALPEECRLFGLLLLAALCDKRPENQRMLRKADGVMVRG